ncbi:MAG TPA: alpha/beta hydrolase [Steroidobacteraceae bacterium]|jgi:acetyl esterase/lipase
MNVPGIHALIVMGVAGITAASPTFAQIPKFKEVPVPRSTESPPGMRVVKPQPDDYVAEYTPNVEYVRRGDLALRLQILAPRGGPPRLPGSAQPEPPPLKRPLVVFVQGSGWGPQNLYSAIPQLSDVAHHGYVVASVEYRPSTVAIAPAQIQDVKTAIRYMRANAARYGIDPQRVAIWGDSSGGHMAALVATTVGVAEFATSDYADQSDAVQAVIDFYGVSDLTTLGRFPSWLEHDAEGSPGSLMLGGSALTHRDKALAHSPVTYITADRKLPPFLLFHGDRDVIVPFDQSVVLYDALRAAGKHVVFYKVEDGNHGWQFWSPRLMQIVVGFLDETL